MGKIVQFLKDVRVELAKVVWPTRKEALKLTAIVVAFSLFVAAFLGLLDYAFTLILTTFLNRH